MSPGIPSSTPSVAMLQQQGFISEGGMLALLASAGMRDGDGFAGDVAWDGEVGCKMGPQDMGGSFLPLLSLSELLRAWFWWIFRVPRQTVLGLEGAVFSCTPSQRGSQWWMV